MIKKVLFCCTILLTVSGCGNSDDTPKLSQESKDQIKLLCARDLNCGKTTSQQACEDSYANLYLQIKEDCLPLYMKMQECALSLTCDKLEKLTGCEDYRLTYVKCDGLPVSDVPQPL